MQLSAKKLTLSAMFISLGLVIPILFHSIGMGSVFLPMFWPVAAAAFFLPISYAIFVGAITPLLSFVISGMPPISPPILQIMMAELTVLAGISSFFYNKKNWSVFWALFIGLLFSRFTLLVGVFLLAPLLGLPPKLFSIASVVKGIPGILVMLIIIPFIKKRI